MAGRFADVNLDLPNLERLYLCKELSPRNLLKRILERVAAYPDPAVWIHLLSTEKVLAEAAAVEERRASGANLPLYGVPFAVKDSIDIAGLPTTAGCPAFSYIANRTAPAVSRLRDAGAILVGKTNLDQFGAGLAGDRSPYGACRNVFHPEYVSGGSSSGSAVAVAAGLVSFAMGTDTAGSGRVPAGCNNIVGYKPTLGLLGTDGVVPSCRSFDCLSIFALTSADACTVCEVALEGSWIEPGGRTLACGAGGWDFPFAMPRAEDLEFFGDEDQENLFRQTLSRFAEMGPRWLAVDFRPFLEVGSLLYEGPWLAERLAAVEGFMKSNAADIHPVTRSLLEGGNRYSAVDVFKATARLKTLRETCMKVFEQAEILLVPTVPRLPKLAEVQADSREWSRRLGYYTNFANLLGLAAIAVPSGFTPRGLPGGITLLGPPGSDRRLCELGMAWQRRVNLPLGATGRRLHAADRTVDTSSCPVPKGFVRVAVAGAHLRGQPLHPDLRRCGASFVRACRTASRYRFLAFLDLKPPRPGLLRDDDRAGAVEVEVFDLPMAGFGRLVASVAPPLAIGTIELADGEKVKGFLCESWDAARARDITDFGGWVAFREHLALSVADPDPAGSGIPLQSRC